MPGRDDLVHRATMLADRMYGRTQLLNDGGLVLLSTIRVALMVSPQPWANPQRVAATVLSGVLDMAAIRNGAAAAAFSKTRIRVRLGTQIADLVEALSSPAAIDPIDGETTEQMEARNFAHFVASPMWIQRVRLMLEMDAMRQMVPAADAEGALEMAQVLGRFREALAPTLGDPRLDEDAIAAVDEVGTAAQAEIDEIAAGPVAP